MSLARQVPIVPPTETLPPLSFPPALSGSNADLRGFVSDMSSGFGAGQPQQFATVSKRALSGSRKSLMASYAEALSRSTEALAMAGADGGYVSQPVSRRGSELVSFGFVTLVFVYTLFNWSLSFIQVFNSSLSFTQVFNWFLSFIQVFNWSLSLTGV